VGDRRLVVNILIAQYGFAPGDISFWRFAVGAVFLCLVFGTRIHLPTLRAAAARGAGGATMAGYVLFRFLGIERIGAAIPR
jgi:DME family drug/metabolite transporter